MMLLMPMPLLHKMYAAQAKSFTININNKLKSSVQMHYQSVKAMTWHIGAKSQELVGKYGMSWPEMYLSIVITLIKYKQYFKKRKDENKRGIAMIIIGKGVLKNRYPRKFFLTLIY